jgi:oligopeptidase B
VLVGSVGLYKDFAVVAEREAGLSHVRVSRTSRPATNTASSSGAVYDVFGAAARSTIPDTVRFTYTSLVTPSSVYEYNLATKDRKLLSGPKSWAVRPVAVRQRAGRGDCPDGVKVPISLVYKKGVKRDGTPGPLVRVRVLRGDLPVGFNSSRLSLLDAGGGVRPGPHPRRQRPRRDWYEAGKMLNKKNTFADSWRVPDHLVAERYGSPDRLVIQGGAAPAGCWSGRASTSGRTCARRPCCRSVRGRGQHHARPRTCRSPSRSTWSGATEPDRRV